MKSAVIVFPGSNNDRDAAEAIRHVGGGEADLLWHADVRSLDAYGLVVLPGGFSYGDYLRAGAIAAILPVMDAVRQHVARGGLVLGICNGFQVLCEAGLLPGALRPNQDLRFHCHPVHLRVERSDLPFTHGFAAGEVIDLPINHGEGNYFAPEDELDRLQKRGGVVLRYVQPDGSSGGNPNGSLDDIAGIVNEEGNVLGLMPHPERNALPMHGSGDGGRLLRSALQAAVRA